MGMEKNELLGIESLLDASRFVTAMKNGISLGDEVLDWVRIASAEASIILWLLATSGMTIEDLGLHIAKVTAAYS